MKHLLITIFTVLLISSSARAWSCGWSPADKLAASIALVGEAGFQAETDHAAILWVFWWKWRKLNQRFPQITPVKVIFAYAKALNGQQPWILGLSFDPRDKPKAWPDRWGKWERYAPLWKRVMDFTDRWCDGRVKDPCNGQARHWGGTIDKPVKNMVAVDCGETKNTFYTLLDRKGRADNGR